MATQDVLRPARADVPPPDPSGALDQRDVGARAPRSRSPRRFHWSRRRWLRLGAALVAGACLALAFPPYGGWPLAFIGVGLLPLAVRGTRLRSAYLLGVIAGLAFFVPTLSWVQFPGVDAWFGLALGEALLLGVTGAGMALVQRLPHGLLWCPAVWVAGEALRARVPFGGFPWSRLAFSQVDEPAVHWAAVGGAPLVTFVTAAAGCAVIGVIQALVRAPRHRRPRPLGAVATVLGLALPAAGALIALPVAGQPDAAGRSSLTVAVVQGNVPRLGLGFDAQRRAVLDDHVAATLQLAAEVKAGTRAAPDIVIWPENSSDIDPFVSPDGYAALDEAAAAIGRPILVGAVLDAGPGKVANTGLVWTATGPTGARYTKHHPVPFGEYVPFRSELTKVIGRLAQDIPDDFIHGTGSAGVPIGPTTVGDVICFEVAYDGLVRNAVNDGGRLLAVQTNNATFGFSAEAAQQLQMTRLRAVEHGRTAVVASTTGISAIIAPNGRIESQTTIFTRALLEQTVPLRSSRTLSDRLGSAPEWAITGLALTAIAGGVLIGRRRRSGVQNS